MWMRFKHVSGSGSIFFQRLKYIFKNLYSFSFLSFYEYRKKHLRIQKSINPIYIIPETQYKSDLFFLKMISYIKALILRNITYRNQK